MTPRICTFVTMALMVCGPALAQDYAFTRDVVGAKSDPTSRDSTYINDATTAGDRAAQHAMEEKTAEKHVRPEHRVLVRKSHGTVKTTDVYLIPAPDVTDDIIYH